ncbi:MAG: response regulator [Oligoflexia bacterium]|nr:response regulator [Oligoflexia bacterium]
MSQSFVLVVDPNPSTARRVENALKGAGYAFLAARDAAQAAALSEGVDLAVVLSCASLPRGNGYDLARQLRERHPAAAVFLLAGGFDVYNQQRAEEAGVTGRIRKPFTADGLRANLEQVLGPLSTGAPASAADDGDPVSDLDRGGLEPLVDTQPVAVGPPALSSLSSTRQPLVADERIATFLPRTYQQLEPVVVDPDVVGPALERAILDVLPVVVQRVLRHSLVSSPEFRDIIEVAVDEAVRAQLPDIAERVARERLREREQRDDPAE